MRTRYARSLTHEQITMCSRDASTHRDINSACERDCLHVAHAAQLLLSHRAVRTRLTRLYRVCRPRKSPSAKRSARTVIKNCCHQMHAHPHDCHGVRSRAQAHMQRSLAVCAGSDVMRTLARMCRRIQAVLLHHGADNSAATARAHHVGIARRFVDACPV